MRKVSFALLFVSFFSFSCCSEEPGDIRRLVDERDLLREQVKSLRDQIKLHTSAKHKACSYLEDHVQELEQTAHLKNNAIKKFQIDIKKTREKTAEITASSCKTGSHEKYGESENQIRFKGKYSFPVEPLKRAKLEDKETLEHIRKGIPIVISGSNLTSSALRWNLDFLAKELEGQFVRVLVSSNRQFRYHNMKYSSSAEFYEWKPPFHVQEGSFQRFVEIVNELKKADNGSRAYFQYLLSDLNLTEAMEEDVSSFHWNWIHDKVLPKTKWGKLKHNLLLVGMNDVSTPVHFDGMENLFSMIHGHKKCILFDPSQYKSLYPFPTHHPHDRQSQVDFDNPKFEMFPRFREVHGYETVLSPGEVLYIPAYWWHYIESERDSMTVSLNFWFFPAWQGKDEDDDDSKDLVPEAVDQVLVRREIESMIAETFHPSKVKDVLKEMLDRRFDFIQAKSEEKENN